MSKCAVCGLDGVREGLVCKRCGWIADQFATSIPDEILDAGNEMSLNEAREKWEKENK